MTSPTKFYQVTQVQQFWTSFRYDLEFLQQCDTRVQTKSQNVFCADSYVCRGYRKKTGRGRGFLPPILNRVENSLYINSLVRGFSVNTLILLDLR